MAKHSPVALLEWTTIHRSSITLFRCSVCVWKRWELLQRKKHEVFLRCSWPKMLWTFVAWWLIFSLSESDRVYFPDSLLGRKMVGAICWDAPRIRWLFSSDEVKVKDCRIQPMSWCFSWWVEPGPNESLMKKDSYSKYEPIHSNYISIATRHEFRVLFSTIQS